MFILKFINYHVTEDCNNRTQLDRDDYYCNEDLVKQLVFDAKLSNPYFKDWIATESDWELARKYNVSVRFIATSSGLTRWHYIFETDKNERVDDSGTRHKDSPDEYDFIFSDKQAHQASCSSFQDVSKISECSETNITTQLKKPGTRQQYFNI